MLEKGEQVSYRQVLEDIKKRDYNDTTRKMNPLRKADDAVELDTSGMTVEEVVKEVLKQYKVKEKRNGNSKTPSGL